LKGRPSGAKALVFFEVFAARLKSCPFKHNQLDFWQTYTSLQLSALKPSTQPLEPIFCKRHLLPLLPHGSSRKNPFVAH
jgi:hypothetical protein